MFNQLFSRSTVLKRYLQAPLLEARLRYLSHRAGQGMASIVLRSIAFYQLVAIKYLDLKNNNRIVTRQEIERAAQRWVHYKTRHLCYAEGNHSEWRAPFVRHISGWLSFLNRIEIAAQPAIPPQVTEFADFLGKERNMSQTTINDYRSELVRFFRQIKEKPKYFLEHLTPVKMDVILMKKIRQGIYTLNTLKHRCKTYRVFFRYAEHRDWCQHGIADSIYVPRIYKHAALPSSPSWEDVRRLLQTTEGNRPHNIRARAILLLLAVYGLRDSEVCRLRLEDFDWEQGILHVKHSKGGRIQKFPIIQTVGQAVLNYLKKVRPSGFVHREVFLTLHAPIRPLATVYRLINERWKPLNIPIKNHGAHSLRHACATRLINQGVPLKVIADQLGHRDLDTTRIYAKVDLPRLREVADFDMGGVL